MFIIDRYILIRFMVNFLILFTLLFVFAVAIDLILHLDDFVDAAHNMVGKSGGWLRFAGAFVVLLADFQGPRIFQFYAYLHGLLAIGAMGFTLAQMHRYRELVAVMASGVSLRRVAMPFLVAVFGLCVLQLLNQELMLPRVAPLLLRGYNDVGKKGINEFSVRFTPDGVGNLLQAPKFNPQTKSLTFPTILQRDQSGLTVQRITADQADWSDKERCWQLIGGRAIRARNSGDASAASSDNDAVMLTQEIKTFQTDLTPQMLLVRHYNQFASMLSLSQIRQMLQTPNFGANDSSRRNTLLRYAYSRMSSVLVNMLVLGLTLPCFLLREPANLLRQSVLCAGLAIPATVGSAIGMMVEMPGIPPAVGVFLPVIVLLFMSMFPWTFFKT